MQTVLRLLKLQLKVKDHMTEFEQIINQQFVLLNNIDAAALTL